MFRNWVEENAGVLNDDCPFYGIHIYNAPRRKLRVSSSAVSRLVDYNLQQLRLPERMAGM